MQLDLIIQQEDFSGDSLMIGLSGGINSVAVLVWLSQYPEHLKPKELHLFYAHFEEHSPDTFTFVKDLIKFARLNFKKVFVKITRNSVLRFFMEQKFIPAPMLAPCTRILKLIPMAVYCADNNITVDLVGYVREETRRAKRMAEKTDGEIVNRTVEVNGLNKHFPISDKTNEWCFQIVEKYIGWYPKIYTIKYRGKRLFTHNNCLPCKNYNTKEMKQVKKHYPEYYNKAMKLSSILQAFWGRNEVEFYTTFGRDINDGCEVCKFD